MKKTIFFGLFLLIANLSKAQFFDNYGLRLGVGVSNQHWSFDYLGYKKDESNKLGFMALINAEKKINALLSIRPEIGYIQKGFTTDVLVTDATGQGVPLQDKKVILHDLSGNIGLKISPLNTAFKPYAMLGFRGDYLLGYKDIETSISGQSEGIYSNLLKEFNKFTLGAVLGIGFELPSKFYVEAEYNPAITKNLETSISIKDRLYGFTVGYWLK